MANFIVDAHPRLPPALELVPMKLELKQPIPDPAIFEPILRGRDVTRLESRGLEVNVALWTLTFVSLLFLSLRLYCKSYKHKDLWWDDWILILSWVRAA